MTRAPKNLSEMPASLPEMASHISQLPRIKDYYDGRRHGLSGLPDNVLLFGRTTARALSDGVRHFHHRHVLIIPLTGQGRIVIAGKAYVLHPGRCGLIAPYEFHHYAGFAEEEIAWLFVTFEWNGERPAGSIFIPREASFWNDAALLFRDYLNESRDLKNNLGCRLGLMLFALQNLRSAKAENRTHSPTDEDLILRVHNLIQSEMGRLTPVQEIAKRAGLSPSHLRSKFRAAAGKSLGAFQREMHLQKAAELLAGGNIPVSEVAELCGWESAFAFSRAFRRYWGRSPKQFALFAKSRKTAPANGKK
jgi:AraC-like DNA-binding protein/quercetin dioxygenase-like cupin family protein